MRKILYIIAFLWCFQSFAQFENIMLPKPRGAKYPYSQVEPSICINPKNTNEVIAGTVMNDYYYSTDGGKTWKSKSIGSKYGVNGDPCMVIDTLERYYYFHLSNIKGEHLIGGMVGQYSKSIKGRCWKHGRTAPNDKYHDKEWVAVNRQNNHLYMTWTQFDAYDSKLDKDKSNIMFSKTLDGKNWSEPVDISYYDGNCLDDDRTAEGAVPSVGPNGEIYVVWARNDSLWFNMSLDEGESWLEKEVFIMDQPMGWVINIPGIYRCNGLPVTACDLSQSEHRGTLYVNWADQKNGENDTDIWLMKSKDGGKTWCDRIRVNTDTSRHHQFLSWMTIDQTNGYLYFVFYDRREHDNDRETDVYLAVSRDGGEHFDNIKISKTPFKPNPKIFFGDYTNISAHNGVIRPIWTRLHYGQINAYTALIEESELIKLKK
ncbi:exo-alpha-sialidase [Paracrocinitomix mangrovi]|uniref:exo-alpha-sialidase n=1 Tax=Paracrocinitomix mangrovi TaxID=2862509 RepID=UPI001C8D6E8F|nr:exo-alpha-sialidase [Paracrocinitomix mangrovi]UKN02869.1 exo-alpha-sialidase [Paracrocinitomix mangrovi]